MSKVTIVDYGVGNLLNVVRAFEHVGAVVTLADTAEAVVAADRLVLPGVGAFADGMRELEARGLTSAIQQHAASGRPFLGICLGMQMMLEDGFEFEHCRGLGLLPGIVESIPVLGSDGRRHKIPHIGWSELHMPAGRADWQGSPLSALPVSAPMYFVHSYRAVPADPDHVLATCDYDGVSICAAVQKGSLWGCQFHPEKSGEQGLLILESFLRQ